MGIMRGFVVTLGVFGPRVGRGWASCSMLWAGRLQDPTLKAPSYTQFFHFGPLGGMADRPRGPKYSMSARFKLSANADPGIFHQDYLSHV